MVEASTTADGTGRNALLQFATALGSTRAIDPEVARHAMSQLNAYLASKFPSVDGADVADVASETIVRIMEEGAIRPERGAMRYLMRKAEWRMLDHLRGHRQEHLQGNDSFAALALTDDEAVRVLEEKATAAAVRGMLNEVRQSGDTVVFRVATYILDIAQRTGEMPSQRAIAAACGISHTAVAKALLRLRSYFGAAAS
jgi:DNA-directed RNA polymerase specialized sigma24 family protein